MSNEARTRSHSWQDPIAAAQAGIALSGFDYLTAMSRGDLPTPPIFSTIGLAEPFIEVERGKVTFFLEPHEYHYNPIGTVHGGVICTLLDSASACAVHSLLPAGTGYTSLELKVNFIRAVHTGSGRMHCVGTVINLGRRTAVCESKLFDEQKKLHATCTQTCLIMPPEK